jgi:hypothetical protein
MNFRKELAPNSGKWAFATAPPVSELRACPCTANRLSAYVHAAKDLLPLREGEWGRQGAGAATCSCTQSSIAQRSDSDSQEN